MASFPLVISFVVTAMILPAFKPESVSSQFNFSKLSVFGDLFFKAPFAMAVIVFYLHLWDLDLLTVLHTYLQTL